MISTKKLLKIARKWRRVAAMSRKRIPFPKVGGHKELQLADRGHCAVYTVDQKRFVFPIGYLNSCVIQELFRLSREEFGLPRDGPITLPCDAAFMDYIISMIQRHTSAEIEKALILSIATNTCSSSYSLQQSQTVQQLLVCSH
ncbi:auxin-responsive protein SAUR64-like [Rhodamnia argentea]|uniref:Auxin-responsive protein SAUR64-like n=1 Tax=Rhodamnia argentea TaxID=178133 RepID=A0A8B8NKV7_9MYRT|nr:auxin-responsive protein SAUR64-like [Rhodamnia argentea]